MKPCMVCGGVLERTDHPCVSSVLQPGLHGVYDEVIYVPAGQEFTRLQSLVVCSECRACYQYITVMNGDQIMKTATKPEKGEKAKVETRLELLERARRLAETIQQVTAQKAAASETYNGQIKEAKNELSDTLALLKDTDPDKTGSDIE